MKIDDRIKSEDAIFINCRFENKEVEQAIVLSVIASGYWPRFWLERNVYNYQKASMKPPLEKILHGVGRSKYSVHVFLHPDVPNIKQTLTHSDLSTVFHCLAMELGMALGGCQKQLTKDDKHQFMAIVPDTYPYQEFLDDFNDNRCLHYKPASLKNDSIINDLINKIVPWLNDLPNRPFAPTPRQIQELWEKFCKIKESEKINYYGKPPIEYEFTKLKLCAIICKICQDHSWQNRPEWYENVEDAIQQTQKEREEKQKKLQNEKEFNVFLSYNSKDRDEVKDIAKQLKDRGIKYWIDIKEIPPGRSIVDEIGNAMSTCATCAIFIGKNGLGEWQQTEIRNAIRRYSEERNPVIPILLRGIERDQIPEGFDFLKNMNIVKCEDENMIDRLIWGITGKKPDNLESSSF
ncbi:hypothetical protein U27_06620 [Candidatus Vecturithrix granuli]|uniref:TIR domain-containing protein n=1 Tax=Vecturithrix granuli TaxID=1499967 RepID=A0A081C4Y0_VECG1|nr:hypothetical protein U27_06620 [Candidatus Vecturithrix granuli]